MAAGRYEYVNLPNYLFLTFLRIWARITAIFFFRKMHVSGKSLIPREGPVIFAVNHQSAFLDPVLIGISSGRKPWYLTRAGVFNGKLVKFILNAIHMLPVYRPRDRVNIKNANQDTFERCNKILRGNGSVLIFPEGNHGMLKRLRVPVKKGIARIALEAEAAESFNLNLKIVPVGINYEHPTKFRTNVLINYGEPFDIKFLEDKFPDGESEALNLLCRRLEQEMSPLMLNIHSEERYDEIERRWMECRPRKRGLIDQFNTDKEIIENLLQGKDCPKSELSSSGFLRIIGGIPGLPLFIIGFVLNLPSILITKAILAKTVIDPHFRQSILFVCGMVIVPLFTVIEASILWQLWGYFWAWLILIPVSGIFAYDYFDMILRRNDYVPTRILAKGFLPK